jgi:secondary thiamine-phosphate synthase enzyme
MSFVLNVQTPSKNCFVEITSQVQSFLTEDPFNAGIIVIYVPHTTAGITINENADPNVVRDFLADLDRLVPQNQGYYRHFEGNSAAHLKASMMGSSVTVIVEEGRMQLGRWQGIYLCEFDGPRTRRVLLEIIPHRS